MPALTDPRAGLGWSYDKGPFGELRNIRPVWTAELDTTTIVNIVRQTLRIPKHSPCMVERLAQGAFNTTYTVRYGGKDIIVRIILPVHPHLKLLSERATIEYVRQHTDIPAPKVLQYNAMLDGYQHVLEHEIAYEWMIMEKVAGTTVLEQWPDMSWLKKELIVRKVVAYLAQLFRRRFDQLGSVYASKDLEHMSAANDMPKYLEHMSADDTDAPDAVPLGAEHSTDTTAFSLGEIVSIPFFYHDHWRVHVPRGPYKHSRDWLAALLQLAMYDADNMSNFRDSDVPEDEDSDEDPDSVEATKSRIRRLYQVMPRIFPVEEQTEEFVLHHQHLTEDNLMVDANHDLSGILGWECTHTLPLWLACQIPPFLRGPDRDEPPSFVAEFKNAAQEDVYYDHMDHFEKTALREFFIAEMKRVCPEWVQVHVDSDMKADFEFAIGMCTRSGYGEDVDAWLDSVENGDEPEPLRAMLGQC
ncbi:hypothetical protein N0V83_007006 [Neocucurbitaria cava]|uniref:Aminoglycoside phosphotransferase domain-containing protein n=1 Tax=Neocucurbitaria cava TaxID=798079 RepID=A0A9W9CKN0_9PLEO|nr:hypothetical protein N0V83_007006 [Neocucurbitaria cava]